MTLRLCWLGRFLNIQMTHDKQSQTNSLIDMEGYFFYWSVIMILNS